MPTPPKPVAVLEAEGRSHRTKEELAQRRQGEKSLLTGQKMRESPAVKGSPAAHQEFRRLRKLLDKIGRDDALYQGVINRYCLLAAECQEFMEKRERFFEAEQRMEERFHSGQSQMEEGQFYRLQAQLRSQVIACDRQVQAKRKMMLDIEKENIMTVLSSLRAVPKQLADEEDEDDPLLELMRRQRETRLRAMDTG